MFVFRIPIQKVISAQQLPKLNKDKHKSIVDPLVRVELYGVPADNASKETHYIENNGDHNTHKHTQMWTHTEFFHALIFILFFFSEHMSHTLPGNKLCTCRILVSCTSWTIINPCRVQSNVEREIPVRHPRPRAGHGAVCGGGLWHNVPEWSHRAVLSTARQCAER